AGDLAREAVADAACAEELFDELEVPARELLVFRTLRVARRIDQQIGDAVHCRDDHDDAVLRAAHVLRSDAHGLGGSDRRSAEFVDIEPAAHAASIQSRAMWTTLHQF